MESGELKFMKTTEEKKSNTPSWGALAYNFHLSWLEKAKLYYFLFT